MLYLTELQAQRSNLGFQADLPVVHISCDWHEPVPLRRDATNPIKKTLKISQFRRCVGSARKDNE